MSLNGLVRKFFYGGSEKSVLSLSGYFDGISKVIIGLSLDIDKEVEIVQESASCGGNSSLPPLVPLGN